MSVFISPHSEIVGAHTVQEKSAGLVVGGDTLQERQRIADPI